jgi:hypothetical protein
MIVAVNAARDGTAGKADAEILQGAHCDCRRSGIMDRRHHDEAAGHQWVSPQLLMRGAEFFLQISATPTANFIESESEPNLGAD